MPASYRASSSQSISPINEQMSVPWVTKYHKKVVKVIQDLMIEVDMSEEEA